MLNALFRWWFQSKGWTTVNNMPEKNNPGDINRYVIIGAPHTSNWDFIYGMGAMNLMKLKIKFTIKKEWIVFPVGKLMLHMGALPIDRHKTSDGKGRSMVDEMSGLLKNATEDTLMVITPEATRSLRTQWKTGFYHVAKGAGVPILLAFIDYEKKQCGIKEVIYPSDDMEADMRKIMAFYQTTVPKHPELFSVDTRYFDQSHKGIDSTSTSRQISR
uniref:Phospholipid/glycerol acyltransferase domain-containing protein n=1 Tax=uncultured Thiotrichaceae bacterium TaxID=298394 RepID=A0A6S6UPC9_9GAMM|nr:MAG: Unknown protein [uncultured Thiotrichaceae bacterium]